MSNDRIAMNDVLGVRGKVWKMAIGNELGLTHELFNQLEQMAREKLEESRQVRLTVLRIFFCKNFSSPG